MAGSAGRRGLPRQAGLRIERYASRSGHSEQRMFPTARKVPRQNVAMNGWNWWFGGICTCARPLNLTLLDNSGLPLRKFDLAQPLIDRGKGCR